MRRFRFRLAKVLRLRERAEQQARLAFAEVLARFQALESRRQSVRLALAQAEDEAASPARSASLAAAYARNLQYEERKLNLEISRISVELQRVREFWLRKRQELRQLERLHELRLEEHREEALRVEQAELEELSAQGFAARRALREPGLTGTEV